MLKLADVGEAFVVAVVVHEGDTGGALLSQILLPAPRRRLSSRFLAPPGWGVRSPPVG